MSNAITRAPQSGAVLRPTSFQELTMFANMASKSAMVPNDYRGKPENIMLAVQMGSEVGLAPMQALQNIAVINGRPALWGDAQLALCRAHPAWVSIEEAMSGAGDARVARCVVTRNGEPPVVRTFSVEDAKRANLWAKSGPWQQYPERMLQMRARGFALRDAFPDALKGLISEHEARDIPAGAPVYTGATIDAVAEPPVSQPAPSPDPLAQPDPLAVPKTPRDFLRVLETMLLAAATPDDAAAILAHPRVQSARETFQNGGKERIDALFAQFGAEIAPDDDGWPGPDVEDAA